MPREFFVHQQSFLKNYPAELKLLAPFMKISSYDKGEVVLCHGDAALNLWLVLNGWIKLVRQTPDGKESIVGLCTEGDVFGEAALLPQKNYPYNAQAISENTKIAAIKSDIVRKLIAENPSFSGSIINLLGERITNTELKLEQMSVMSAAQRLGCFLLRLCHQQKQKNSAKLSLPVDKHILAAYLGMKPETLSRSQQQLKSFGISVAGSSVIIEQIEKLSEFVCNSCSQSGSCEVEECKIEAEEA